MIECCNTSFKFLYLFVVLKYKEGGRFKKRKMIKTIKYSAPK